ncbi:MAG: hypothetical protein NTZ19_13815 [Bacteroidetes bacterium]|nr:hypothetical protein [Bacteroidota bacterium]
MLKKKRKIDPFLIFTVLFLIGLFAGFIIKTIYFTPKEIIIKIDAKDLKAPVKNEREVTKKIPSNEEDKKLFLRNNWRDFISIGTIHKDVNYIVSPDGRITKLTVPLINKTDYPIESITIRVFYINQGNKNTLESTSFEVKNILPGKNMSYPSPESKVKGVTIICEISKMHSANFGFCYDQDLFTDQGNRGGFSGNPADPWHCK